MKLFVSNISRDTTEQQLRDVIEPVASVLDFHRPNDRETGDPRSFAFVTVGSREEGEKAVEALGNTEIDGRTPKANEAEERGPAHPADRPQRVSMHVPKQRPVDDRPIGADGRRVRYKSI